MKKILLACGLLAMALTATAQNPFAYNISATNIPANGVLEDDELAINYTLNANAVSAGIVFLNGDQEVSRVAFDASLCTKGDHQTTVSLEGLPKGVNLKWKIYAEGQKLTAPSAITYIQAPSGGDLKVWSPYAMAIDNNPESEHFGRILYTESHAGVLAKTSGYLSITDGVGLGVYELDPQQNLVKNAAGTYGYNGGINWTSKSYTSYTGISGTSSSAIFGPKRVKISKDGRIFVSVADLDNCPLYEMNPDDLSQWTPVLEGSYSQEVDGRPGRWWVNNDGEVIGSAAHGLAVQGEGDDLKVAIYYCGNGLNTGLPSYCGAMEYDLGSATSTATASEVEALKGKYTQNAQYTDIAYDGRGGILYTHYRAKSSADLVVLAYVNAQGEETGHIIQNNGLEMRAGGIVFSDDYSLVALGTNTQEITVYKVGYGDEVQNPTIDLGDLKLTQLYKISNNGFNGNTALGFDIANNLYTCTNNKELLGFHALPREGEPICEVPARAEFTFQLPVAMVTVTGKVTMAPRRTDAALITAGDGIEGAEVTFDDGTNQYSGTTDANGDYSIDMPAGTYTVTIEEPTHFMPYTEENVVVSDDPTAAPVLNFSMQFDYTTGVTDVNAAGSVVGVKYYDLNGRESAAPVKGVNVKVTIMSDGRRITEKVLK